MRALVTMSEDDADEREMARILAPRGERLRVPEPAAHGRPSRQ